MISEDAKALMNYLKALINEEPFDFTVPEKFVGDADFLELYEDLLNIRNFGIALGKGDLSQSVKGSGIVLKSMEDFQKRFKNFGSRADEIIPYDLSVGDTLPFDFTDIFESMNKQIEYSNRRHKESEERYRLLIDNAGDIISTVNLQGEFTYISPSVEKITGYTVEEVMNHYREINYFLPDALKVMEKTLEIINRMVKSGEHFDAVRFEQQQFRKDGTVIYTDTIMSGIYDEDNQFKEILGVTRDITEKVKLREEIIKLSETDKLTRLYNRYKLDDVLEKELKRSRRTLIPFAVILLDIDYFKQVNDRFGHQVGDRILQELAAVLKNSIRSTDIVGRWGGEEFMFILPDTDECGAMLLAKKIRKRISETQFPHPEKITGSLGVSVFRSDRVVATIISRADQALYTAKRNGRNQVQLL